MVDKMSYLSMEYRKTEAMVELCMVGTIAVELMNKEPADWYPCRAEH